MHPPPILFSSPELAPVGEVLTTRWAAARGKFKTQTFPNGELSVEISSDVGGRRVIAVLTVSPPAERFVLALYLIDTLRRLGASTLEVVMPYLAYSRHDRASPGVGRMFLLLGPLLRAAGATRLVTLDLHHPAFATDFGIPLNSITSIPLFAARLRGTPYESATIVAPDEGAWHRAVGLAQALGGTNPIVRGSKHRTREGVTVELQGTTGPNAVVIDDILDTGGTLLQTMHALRRKGVQRVILCVSHGLFTGERWRELWDLGVERIYTTDSVGRDSVPTDDRIEIIPCGSIIADSIEQQM